MSEIKTWKQYFCAICMAHCSALAKVEDGMITELIEDTISGFPANYCPKHKGGLHVTGVGGILRNRERLQYPLKREGKRGEGKWKRISWDEALNIVAEKLKEIKEKYGPEHVAILLDEPKGLEFAFAQRFATAYGTPNVFTPGTYCGVPTYQANYFTFGSQTIQVRKPIYYYYPRVIIIWGSNPIHTGGTLNGLLRRDIHLAMDRGCKIVVIDPKNIDVDPHTGKRASDVDYWLKLRPASDGILAMGMLKIVVEEELYDKDFVAKWTVGFEKLKEEIKKFTLEDVEKLTWVPKQQIREVARLYATNKPGVIGFGNALEQTVTAFQTCRAIAILRGITGNVNTPDGGEVDYEPPTFTRAGSFIFGGKMKEKLQEFPRSPERTIGGEFKVALRSAYVPTPLFAKSILEEKPYPLKAVLVLGSNPLITYPDSNEVYKAFMKLDFVVVIDIFHTPTTALADIVLPAATLLEREDLGYWPAGLGAIKVYPKLVEPPGEAWSDLKIINELAKKMGLGEYFFENEHEALDLMLKPTNLTYKEFAEKVRLIPPKPLYDPFKVIGYRTPSGKVEIYSKQLEEFGFSPIPRFEELTKSVSGSFEPTEEYPLLLTNGKDELYRLSSFRNLRKLRVVSPHPIVWLNTETAEKLGLKNGDWVYIETKKGRVKQKLVTDPYIHPKVVLASFGYWGEFNLNQIIDGNPPYEPVSGSPQLKGIPCRVYKAT